MASNSRGRSRGYRGGGRGDRGYWRGHGASTDRSRGQTSGQINPAQKKPQNVRPTHFLALPLHNHPALRSTVAAFQAALFGASSNTQSSRNAVRTSPHVRGLDSSIVIDPVRMHMTLGVMALESEYDAVANDGEGTSSGQRKTVSTALALLSSLSPQISQILGHDNAVKVPLEVLDVLKTEKMRSRNQTETGKDENIGAGVLFLGPRESTPEAMNAERRKLMDVCELINRTFRNAGYFTDLRPLKLHCTILNASHRKPRGWFPFSYSDIRSNKMACDLIRSRVLVTAPEDLETRNPTSSASVQNDAKLLPPMPVNLGTWEVDEVQLWVMGSRDGEGRYVNCGGIKLVGK